MSQEQFKRERNYRVALSIAKSMFSRNLITEAEYRKIDKMLVSKYKPIIGGL